MHEQGQEHEKDSRPDAKGIETQKRRQRNQLNGNQAVMKIHPDQRDERVDCQKNRHDQKLLKKQQHAKTKQHENNYLDILLEKFFDSGAEMREESLHWIRGRKESINILLIIS